MYFSLKAFLIGMGVVIAIYLALFVFVLLRSSKTITDMEEKLVSQSILIERNNTTSKNITIHEPEIHTNAEVKPNTEVKSHLEQLPIMQNNELTPFKNYKKEFFADGKPMICVVINDYGLSKKSSAMALEELPSEVSLILSPYSQNPDKWQKHAVEAGHEIWLYLPMENEKVLQEDPGQQALLSHKSITYNQERLDWVLARTTGYTGVAAYSDSIFSDTETIMQNLFKSLFSKGLGFMELNPESPPFLETIALSKQTPYARNHVFLNQSSLKSLEKTAQQYGYAVGVLKPYPNSIKSVKAWMDTLSDKGFVIAPVSAVAEMNSQ